MRTTIMAVTLMLAGVVGLGQASASHGEWLGQVPEKDRARVNPMGEDGSAVAAGAQIYEQHCASCHGNEGVGIGRRPSLRTARVHGATDGELQWLLRNGSLRRGMPAWARLPEAQRWQLVRYVHSLPVEPGR